MLAPFESVDPFASGKIPRSSYTSDLGVSCCASVQVCVFDCAMAKEDVSLRDRSEQSPSIESARGSNVRQRTGRLSRW